MNQASGSVYLVGAGCGQADLITVRGQSFLQNCDVVVYDDLIAAELLDMVPTGTQRIYMGKRQGRHSAHQKAICDTLVALAREGKTVVRLKGGDPFVFGRGGEEMLALKAAGIPCEEVPGISSAIAIPALAGIPVTHRGLSRSIHIITAHTADTGDSLPSGFNQLAKLPGTLVFLMGLSQLSQITRRLLQEGMEPFTPAAVVSNGNSPHPAAVRGTLEDIADRARNVRPPAVIVVGAAAAMELTSSISRPLLGVRIGLTGTASVTDQLSTALRAQGADVFLAERTIVKELPLSFDLQTLCSPQRHWVVFTSSNGVHIFFRHLRRQQIDLRRLNGCHFAVIGTGTSKALAEYGIQADLCPPIYTSAALGECLLTVAQPDESVFLFRSSLGSAQLFQTLSAKLSVRDIPLYDLAADSIISSVAAERLENTDYLTFSSASGVELFFGAHGAVPESAFCVCIGGVTGEALRRRYSKPFLVAASISTAGIVDTIMQHQMAKINHQTKEHNK